MADRPKVTRARVGLRRRGRATRAWRRAAIGLGLGLGLAGPTRARAAEPGRDAGYHLDLVLPSVRLGLGAGFVREDVGFGAGFGAQVQLGAQLHLVSVPRRPIVFLQPLAGYAHVGVSSGPLNAFTLGLGVGVGGRLLRGMLRPQVVLGGYGPSFTAGARTSVALEVWMGALGIEAGHDYLGLGGGGRHGGHLMLTTDLIAVGLVAVRRWWQG